jgi:hypothetical protein
MFYLVWVRDTNPVRQVAVANKFCTMAPDSTVIMEFAAYHSLAPIILRCLLGFWKNCTPLF